MSSNSNNGDGSGFDGAAFESVEYMLFDSLAHHLVEKGLLTKNDALSVIQTAAEVVRGQMHEAAGAARADAALATLERSYRSFEALPERYGRAGLNADNVLPLRSPLHGDRPQFPREGDD